LREYVDEKSEEFLKNRFLSKIIENKKEDQEELKLIVGYFYQNLNKVLESHIQLCEASAQKAVNEQEKCLFQQFIDDINIFTRGLLEEYETKFGPLDKQIQSKELNPLVKEYKQYYNSIVSEGSYYENIATICGGLWFYCEVAEKARKLPNFTPNPYFEYIYAFLNTVKIVNNVLIRMFETKNSRLTDEEKEAIYKAFTDAIYYEDIFYSSCLVEVN